MPLVGGLRDRMVIESLGKHITGELTTLGWFDSGREHNPVVVVSGFPNDTDEVALNTIAYSVEDASGEGAEMGSRAEVHETFFFMDFFAQDDSLGWHLSGDVYSFLKRNPILDIFDYNTAGDPVDFQVELLDVDRRKPSRAVNAWQRHWFTVSFMAEDFRDNA